MRRLLTVITALTMTIALAACGNQANNDSSDRSQNEPVTLTVFAAASMEETLNQIIEQYRAVAPDVTITPTYDSSGTLKKQIVQGADCDLFISASEDKIDQLDGALVSDSDKNPDGLDLIDSDSRIDLLENKVVLVVPEGNPAGINSFSDLASDRLHMIALGNSDVPVGSYSLEILQAIHLDVAELENSGKITYGSNVKEVTTQVTEGTVDCGIIYATDAYSAQQNGSGMQVVDTATADLCSRAIYPAAILKNSAQPDAAAAFLDYLQTGGCTEIFESVGFTALNG